jgi:hypothetical protein
VGKAGGGSIDDLGSQRRDRLDNLGYQCIRDPKLLESLDEMFRDEIEVNLLDGEAGMRGVHLCAAVLLWSAKRMGEEGCLVSLEAGHGDALKEGDELRIGKHASVELLDCCAKGDFATEALRSCRCWMATRSPI